MNPLGPVVRSALLSPVTAATTARTANLDTQDANHACIVVSIGAEANTNATGVTVQLSESDDTVATNFATWSSDYTHSAVDNTAGTIVIDPIKLDSRKRYIRLTITPDTTTNGAVITSAVAELTKGVKTGTASDYSNANQNVI